MNMKKMNRIFNKNFIGKLIILACYLLLNGCGDKSDKNIKINYYSDGKIKSIMSYRNRILNGECIWFYSNGFVERKVIYVDGEMNGRSYYFYASGNLKSDRFWKNNKSVGFGAEYWDNEMGLIKASLLFDNNG